MLRRRTGWFLSSLLLVALAAGAVGAAYIAWREPPSVLGIAFVASALAGAVCVMLDECGKLFAALALIFTFLGCGLYALWLLGAGMTAVAWSAVGLIGLVFVILGRALIAAGSADYPYDD